MRPYDNVARTLLTLPPVACALALAAPAAARAQSGPAHEGGRAVIAAESAPRAPAGAPAAPPATPSAAGGPAASAPAGGARALEQAPPAPTVDVRGPRGLLESRTNPFQGEPLGADDTRGWQPVCALPCRRALDPSLEYRVVGTRFARFDRTDAFRLPPGRPEVRLDVDLASRAARSTGFDLTVVGSGMALGGLLFTLGLLGSVDSGLESKGEQRVTRAIAIGGLAVSGAGVVMLATGLTLLLANRTHVTMTGPGGPAVRFTSGLRLTPRGLTF